MIRINCDRWTNDVCTARIAICLHGLEQFGWWLGWLTNRKSCLLLFHWFLLCFLNFVLSVCVCVLVFSRLRKMITNHVSPAVNFATSNHSLLSWKKVDRIAHYVFSGNNLLRNNSCVECFFFAPCEMTKSAKIDPFTGSIHIYSFNSNINMYDDVFNWIFWPNFNEKKSSEKKIACVKKRCLDWTLYALQIHRDIKIVVTFESHVSQSM